MTMYSPKSPPLPPTQPTQPVANKAMSENTHKPFVEKQVLEVIGKIKNMKMIRAYNVFDNNWRVNIWCETKTEGCIVPKLDIRYSYFIRADKEGNIINSSPELGVESN